MSAIGNIGGTRCGFAQAELARCVVGGHDLGNRASRGAKAKAVHLNGEREATERFDMGKSESENQVTLAQLSKRVGQLQPDGGTAIYDSLIQAYTEALARRRADPERFYSIVVMTDGVNTQGASSYDFARWHAALPAAERDLRVFPVVFGEADPAELQHVAELTGGRSFDSRKSSLAALFKEIRGYQ